MERCLGKLEVGWDSYISFVTNEKVANITVLALMVISIALYLVLSSKSNGAGLRIARNVLLITQAISIVLIFMHRIPKYTAMCLE